MTDTSDERTKDIRYDPATWKHGWAASAIIRDLFARIDELREQLPDGMSHCIIRFVECKEGHGRLTATNWVDDGCNRCRVVELEAEVNVAGERAAEWARVADDRKELLTERNAEIERLRAELANWTSAQKLSQTTVMDFATATRLIRDMQREHE